MEACRRFRATYSRELTSCTRDTTTDYSVPVSLNFTAWASREDVWEKLRRIIEKKIQYWLDISRRLLRLFGKIIVIGEYENETNTKANARIENWNWKVWSGWGVKIDALDMKDTLRAEVSTIFLDWSRKTKETSARRVDKGRFHL